MYLKINFAGSDKPFKKPTQEYVNRFINDLLGENNKYHDKFSNYSISQLRGGQLNENKEMIYPNGGYLFISSQDQNFIGDIINSLFKLDSIYLQNMKYIGMDINPRKIMPEYDIVRIECLRLKENDKNITFEDIGVENYIKKLQEHVKKKLLNNGYDNSQLKTLEILPFHEENWKIKYLKMKTYTDKPVLNKTSNIMICLKGNKNIRKDILSLGFGLSTGCGCGFGLTKELINY